MKHLANFKTPPQIAALINNWQGLETPPAQNALVQTISQMKSFYAVCDGLAVQSS